MAQSNRGIAGYGPAAGTEMNSQAKAELRTKMRSILRKIPPTQRQDESSRARGLLAQQSAWRKARSILFFAPRADELDLLAALDDALAAGKTVALPRYAPETGTYVACQIGHFTLDCAPGKFGIFEPAATCAILPLNRLDLALVPGLAFDLSGHRLGRGNGYYDRILAEVAGTRCGVAFDEQLIEHIPAEPHDIELNCILTPTKWVDILGPNLTSP